MNTSFAISGLRRDGHLTDLAIDHQLDGSGLLDAQAHLEACQICQARLEAARAMEASLPSLPAIDFSSLPSAEEPAYSTLKAANRPWKWASMLAVAAVGVFVATAALRAPEEEGYRVKGGGLSLQVFRDAGESSERLRNGDLIQPGDRLGFRVRQRRSGHLMIIGVDALDEPYLCFPQSKEGHSEEMDATLEPRPLPEAIRMDTTPGAEMIVAVLCEHPFTYADMTEAISLQQLPDDCLSDSIELVKP